MNLIFIIILVIVGSMILFFNIADMMNKNRKQKPFIKHVRFKKMMNDGLDLDGDYGNISISHSYCDNGKWIAEV